MSQLRDRIGHQIILYRGRGQSKLLTMLVEQAPCARDLCADKSSAWDASIQFRELSIQSTKVPTTVSDCETFSSGLFILLSQRMSPHLLLLVLFAISYSATSALNIAQPQTLNLPLPPQHHLPSCPQSKISHHQPIPTSNASNAPSSVAKPVPASKTAG